MVSQPPLGGCVLKQITTLVITRSTAQPPLGGCVLKLYDKINPDWYHTQPPLGGCVLKPRPAESFVLQPFSRL